MPDELGIGLSTEYANKKIDADADIEVHLDVKLPKDRNYSGTLFVRSKGKIVESFEALGRGSRGPGDTQMKNKGNTPTGGYIGSKIVDTRAWPKNSYGGNGAIRLQPISGNALDAGKAGRKGLLIHGGAPADDGYWRKKIEDSDLRATHGCIRLSNADMKKLVETIQLESEDHDAKMCRPVVLKISVSEE